MKIQGDRFEAKATIVIDTNALHFITKTFSRNHQKLEENDGPLNDRIEEMEAVKFQIHSSDNLPIMSSDSGLDQSMDSLTLIAGNFTIYITTLGLTRQRQ